MALANGLFMSIFGNSISELAVNGVNIVLLLFIFTTIHLQHSHIDIKFTGFWGKVFFSPAHHHIHHSNNPDHYGKNMGSCLSVWDYIFGTLVLPETYKRRLKFGVDKDGVDDHSVYGGLIYPFVRAHAHTKRALSIALLQLKLLNAYSHRSKGKLS
jgi:sterol desaturase/sphingolipid hydroxylase (fatty acid hydroxylase superfamily)